jgi:hypothetical protein
MKLTLPVSLALCTFLGACASSGKTDEKARVGPLPTPFSAAEIRDANPPGTERTYLVSGGGMGPRIERGRFLPDEPGYGHFENSSADLAGAALEVASEGRATWEELRRHAEFPAAEARRFEETCTVAAGIFDCWIYERVQQPAAPGGPPVLHRYAFARAHPGPPILYEMSQGGGLLYRMELIELNSVE